MKVSISSKVTLLRPQATSIAFGIMWALLVFTVTLVAVITGEGGASRLIRLFGVIYPFYGLNILGLLSGLIFGFINGYIFGFLVGFVYSWLMRRVVADDDHSDPIFEYDRSKQINVLQEGEGDNPYTIVFVANPLIAELLPLADPDDPDEEDRFVINAIDPIIQNEDLFVRMVTYSLRSFANNELLKIPAIISRLKIVTIFDRRSEADLRAGGNANALCQNTRIGNEVLSPRKRKIEHTASDEYILDTASDITSTYINTIDVENEIGHVDIVYVLSAYKPLFRSAALFTVDQEGAAVAGQQFTFSHSENTFNKRHVHFAQSPGLVALSAYDDNPKSPIHEYAHAMSSLQNGAIMDEYSDNHREEDIIFFMINKRFKAEHDDPVPHHFATYYLAGQEEAKYYSDRARADKEPDWHSYTPERIGPGISCTMDVTYFRYRFDKLLFDFMYDRLFAKINR